MSTPNPTPWIGDRNPHDGTPACGHAMCGCAIGDWSVASDTVRDAGLRGWQTASRVASTPVARAETAARCAFAAAAEAGWYTDATRREYLAMRALVAAIAPGR